MSVLVTMPGMLVTGFRSAATLYTSAGQGRRKQKRSGQKERKTQGEKETERGSEAYLHLTGGRTATPQVTIGMYIYIYII
jgi:hypothetical protein